ncbi:hypothetical protein [Clostridium cellulovorans]|uniref:Uncharacterized protein n=1 Tax=Clostridium cellulovorans (strain ATCC 35296 / DSM 3052 / OCM 3 / 743B) TaxID=573061 RepID=D9SWH5_CLOC7|nr:hypothetical protein [Clostridium cellulovorans]ADL53257.1 hypothetical protein Clocel_3582 [Clostridium cellulovorans 743B]
MNYKEILEKQITRLEDIQEKASSQAMDRYGNKCYSANTLLVAVQASEKIIEIVNTLSILNDIELSAQEGQVQEQIENISIEIDSIELAKNLASHDTCVTKQRQ